MASKPRLSTATSRSGRTKSPKARGTEADKEQAARFIETAREVEAEKTGKEFLRALDVILPPKRD